MKLPLKIVLCSIAFTIVLAFLLASGTSSSLNDVLGFFGLADIIIGPLLLFSGLIALATRHKEWAQGLLLSGGILLLLGFLTCSSLLSGFH